MAVKIFTKKIRKNYGLARENAKPVDRHVETLQTRKMERRRPSRVAGAKTSRFFYPSAVDKTR